MKEVINMLFIKREVTPEDRLEFSMVPLIDPVSRVGITPNHVTVNENEDVYLVSLSNQHISFIYEMPRYFTLVYHGLYVFFFVINQAEKGADDSKVIFVKGLKFPRKLENEKEAVCQAIKAALMTYYAEYTIGELVVDSEEKIHYYRRIIKGELFDN